MMNPFKKIETAIVFGMVYMLSQPAFAATDISSLFDEIDLSGISTKVLAAGVLIVGIAFVIKGPSIVKRLISKI